MLKFILPLLTLTAFCLADYQAKVISVSDGDTIKVLVGGNEVVKIRLHGIDAPEKKQAFGVVAKNALGSKVAGKIINVAPTGKDRYKRELAKIYLDNEDINRYLVRNGYAWAFIKYSKDYIFDENYARAHKLGLWQDIDPTPPWDFRKAKKKHKIK